jgi:5-methylcytosine-specific restriction endonuclease McrA
LSRILSYPSNTRIKNCHGKKIEKMPTVSRRIEPKINRQGRNYRAFYQSARWHRISLQVRKAQPLCQRCLAEGKTERSEVTDHVVPLVVWIPMGGDPYDTTNMQALSKSCHSIKTIEDKKKYGTVD